MNKFISLIAVLCCVIIVTGQVEYPYDFNNLSIGNLNGQDNWVTILQTAGTADLVVDLTGNGVVSPDGTQAVFYNAGGPGWGRTATRKASPNFNFDFTQGGVVEMEIDMYRNYWGMFFGAGYDADGDGYIAPGLNTEPNDGGIQLAISGYNSTTNNKVIMPDGDEIIYNINNEGWARYKMVMDFTANGGEGAFALFYKQGTTGNWIAVSEVQGVNMGMTPGSGNKQDYSVWDGIFFHSQGATGVFDNILIRIPENSGQLQFIDFTSIPDKLTTSPPFALQAIATSGLPVDFEIVEGPASVSGNIITLVGVAGIVTVKASQPGNGTWAPAPDVFNSFEVVDPMAYQPDLKVRRPADETNVYMTELSPIILLASAYIDHPDVLIIEQVTYQIGNQSGILTEKDWNTGYFSAEWTPPSFGNYNMIINVTSTGGVVSSETISFIVTDDIADLTVPAFDLVQIMAGHQTDTAEFVFPCYVGSFDQITAYLDVTCPAGGCDPWDRVGSMEARGPSGQWVEILRYITPYGVPCNHSIDVTDYASIFQGLVEMRFNIGTPDPNGFIVDVNFDLHEGTPQYKYSWVDVIWRGTFPFGDYANLQPMDTVIWNYEPFTEASKIKILNTGHGWGQTNTGNAAEFYEATHHIKVNSTSFDQHLWVDCNPNPDGCQPQNGTWYFNRAGWCPGSISYVYDYDLTPFVNISDISIIYEFFPGYVDMCHPNHPDCITGVTCSDCNAGFNPHYIISGNLISYSNNLFITTGQEENSDLMLSITPNPSLGEIHLTTNCPLIESTTLRIYNYSGQLLEEIPWKTNDEFINLKHLPGGLYFIKVLASGIEETEKFIIQ